MIRFAWIAMLLVGLAGCAAHKVWYNASVSNQQAQQDLRECKYDSTKYGSRAGRWCEHEPVA